MRGLRITTLAALLITVHPVSGESPSGDPALRALAGLDVVHVLVESPTTELERAGLSEHALVKAVEEQLLDAGIRVASREESLRQGVADLVVHIGAIPDCSTGTHGFAVDASVREPVLLVRDRDRSVVATTWAAPTAVDPVVDGAAARGLLDLLRSQVDVFIRDYASTNGTTGVSR